MTGPSQSHKARIRVPVAALLAAGVTFWSLKNSAAPFVWIGVVWAAALIWTAWVSTRVWIQAVAVNLAILLLSLTGFEFYLFWGHRQGETAQHTTVPYVAADPVLGVAGKRNVVTRVTRTHQGGIDYDVTYRLDAHGLRATREPSTGPVQGCMVFFGCSFTFGDGVNDDETLPSQVVEKTGGRYRAVNFGIGGSGAHQVLAQLESGLVDAKSDCTPTRALYSAIPHHVYRAAGKPPKYNFGPRYVRESDGRVVRSGRIEDARGQSLIEQSPLLSQLLKSHIYQQILDWPRVTPADVATYVAIVQAADQLFRRQFPGASFEVLLWDDVPYGETALYEQVREELRRGGLQVYLVPEILQGYREDRSRYQLSPRDRHPNALAYAGLADWVVRDLLREKMADRTRLSLP